MRIAGGIFGGPHRGVGEENRPVPSLNIQALDWVIVGGEKAVGARPMLAEWVMPIKEDARVSGIPFFFKQWGPASTQFHPEMFDGDVWQQFPG